MDVTASIMILFNAVAPSNAMYAIVVTDFGSVIVVIEVASFRKRDGIDRISFGNLTYVMDLHSLQVNQLSDLREFGRISDSKFSQPEKAYSANTVKTSGIEIDSIPLN